MRCTHTSAELKHQSGSFLHVLLETPNHTNHPIGSHTVLSCSGQERSPWSATRGGLDGGATL